METLKLKHYAHKVGINVHHLIWCTKYRYRMFKQEKYKNLCEELLTEIAYRHNMINIMLTLIIMLFMSIRLFCDMSIRLFTPHSLHMSCVFLCI